MPKLYIEDSLDLENGAVYTKGDTIEVFPNEAAALVATFPKHFSPVDFDLKDAKDPVPATYRLFVDGKLNIRGDLKKKSG